MRRFLILSLLCAALASCTYIKREYHITVYATEGSDINFEVEVLAEVPKDIKIESQIEGELDLPDANVIGK